MLNPNMAFYVHSTPAFCKITPGKYFFNGEKTSKTRMGKTYRSGASSHRSLGKYQAQRDMLIARNLKVRAEVGIMPREGKLPTTLTLLGLTLC